MTNYAEVLQAMTKDAKEAIEFMASCGNRESSVQIHVEDAFDSVIELYETLYDNTSDSIFITRLAECKDYFYKEGYKNWNTDTFIETIYSLLHETVPHNSVESMRSLVELCFGESFMNLCPSNDLEEESEEIELEYHEELDLYEHRICDTIVQFKPVSDEISEFTLIDLDIEPRVFHIDWCDHETLKEVADSIYSYLQIKQQQ